MFTTKNHTTSHTYKHTHSYIQKKEYP